MNRRDRRSPSAPTHRSTAARHPGKSGHRRDRKSTRLNSSHGYISYAVFCLKKKKNKLFHTHTESALYQLIHASNTLLHNAHVFTTAAKLLLFLIHTVG